MTRSRAQDLAAEVTRDMPDATIEAKLAEAMKRCKGTENPSFVREWLKVAAELYKPRLIVL